jgi:steroid delta-isomerase-like uncharacterized protein
MSLATDTEKLIRAYYDAFNRGDMQTFLSLLDEGVVHEINQGGVETGKAAFTRFMDRMNHHYQEQIRDLAVMVDSTGRRAAAEFRVLGSYKVTDPGLPAARGQSYDLPVGAFFEINDGKVARVTNYYNLRQWTDMVK